MLNNGKAKIHESLDSFEIVVPSKKNWFVLIFATVWLAGWAFGFLMASSFLFDDFGNDSGPMGFITFWLIGWTIGGLFVLFILLWGYFGMEKIGFKSGEVTLEKTVFGVGIKKKLETVYVKNFRSEKVNESLFGNRWSVWGLGPGKIKFDYGMKTFSFGLGVADAEANYLVEILSEKTSGAS